MTITTYLVAPVALTENTAQFIAQLLQTFITFLSLNTNAFTNVFLLIKTSTDVCTNCFKTTK